MMDAMVPALVNVTLIWKNWVSGIELHAQIVPMTSLVPLALVSVMFVSVVHAMMASTALDTVTVLQLPGVRIVERIALEDRGTHVLVMESALTCGTALESARASLAFLDMLVRMPVLETSTQRMQLFPAPPMECVMMDIRVQVNVRVISPTVELIAV